MRTDLIPIRERTLYDLAHILWRLRSEPIKLDLSIYQIAKHLVYQMTPEQAANFNRIYDPYDELGCAAQTPTHDAAASDETAPTNQTKH